MQVSVVLPTYNRKDVLMGKTLPALENQDFDKNGYEIIIVDDGSTDDTSKEVANYASKANVPIKLLTQQNLGAASARNKGIKIARGGVIIIIGDDTYPESDNFIKTHYQFHQMNTEPNISMLGYTVWDPDIETPFMKWLQDTQKQFAYGLLKDNSFVAYKYLYTSNISFKKEYLAGEDKLLDESFKKAAYEDTEWGYRLQNKYGLKLYYNSKAKLLHRHTYNPFGFMKRWYVCEKEWEKVKVRFPELYKDHSESHLLRIFKSLIKTIVLNEFVSRFIKYDTNFDKYPVILWEGMLKLMLQKYRHEQKRIDH